MFLIWQSFCNAQRVFQTTLAIVASKVNEKAKVNREQKVEEEEVIFKIVYIYYFCLVFFVF
jgi:hypothetical protein